MEEYYVDDGDFNNDDGDNNNDADEDDDDDDGDNEYSTRACSRMNCWLKGKTDKTE